MRRRVAIPILIALFALVPGVASKAERELKDGLEVTFNANFAPHVLPRDRAVPVKVQIQGRIATVDGSHPPPLRWLEVELNRNGQLFSEGLPICLAPALQSTSTATALGRCRPALVGRGNFRATVNLGRAVPVIGKIRAFNSRKAGKEAVLLHLFAAAPVRFTLVVPLTISHRPEEQFGTVLRAKVPRLGGDLGSVTQIELTIGRRFSFQGKRHSYVSAACRAPEGFTSVPFTLAVGSFRFEAHRKIRMPVTRTCRVR
jgi:hypothetical protein